MKDCSVVTATYDLGEGVKGTIGIVGPKRMDYENVVDNLKNLKSLLDGIFDKEKGQSLFVCKHGREQKSHGRRGSRYKRNQGRTDM